MSEDHSLHDDGLKGEEYHSDAGAGHSCSYIPLILIVVVLLIAHSFHFLPHRRLIKSAWERLFAKHLPDMHKRFNAAMGKHKEKLFDGLKDDVGPSGKLHIIEIGAGTGANFKFFPQGTRVTCIEPNAKCEENLKKSVAETNGDVVLEEFHVGKAEDMGHITTDSVDAVVCSLVMCSVDNVDGTLREVKRILKPGGKLYFIEHSVADKGSPGRIPQLMFIYFMEYLLDKKINREAHLNIQKAGFSHLDLEFYDAPHLKDFLPWWIRPFIATRHYQGTATK